METNKNTCLFYYHAHKICLKKLVPLKVCRNMFQEIIKRNQPNRFQTLLFAEIWVSKNPGFVPGSPPGGLYLQRWPHKNTFWKCQKTSNIVICWQDGYFFMHLYRFFLPPTPPFRFPPLHRIGAHAHPKWAPIRGAHAHPKWESTEIHRWP